MSEHLRERVVEVFDCPANSPDLNSMKTCSLWENYYRVALIIVATRFYNFSLPINIPLFNL